MQPVITLARLAGLTLATILLVPNAPAAQFPFKGTIGTGVIGDPMDVAIYSPTEREGFAFVVGTDSSSVPRLWRFPLSLTGTAASGPAKSFNISYIAQGNPTAVAVNDLPEHCNKGQVYVTFPTMIAVFDTNGFLLMTLSWTDGAGGGFVSLTGIDVDNEGNVYVSDNGRDLIVKFDSTDFGLPHFVDKLLPAELSFDAWPGGKSLDVSVDVCHRIHVTNTCGCYSVSNPDGSLWSINGSGAAHLPGQEGVTALSPLEESWVTSAFGYHYDWETATTNFVQDYTVGSTILTNTRGIEYHKFFLSRGHPGSPQKGYERLYVADRGHSRVSVFGEDHNSVLIDPSAAGFWRFDDLHHNCADTAVTVVNAIAGGNSGTAIGSPAPHVAKGVVDHSVQFIGGNGAIQVPSYTAIEMSTTAFTIEGWLRAEYDGGTRIVLDKRVGTGAGYELYLWHGFLGVQLNDGTTFQNCASVLPANMLADGEWHHFAVVIDWLASSGASVSFYDDGTPTEALPVDSALNKSLIPTAAPLIIGRENPSSTSNGILGNLDDLAIYSSALTPPQINAIYTAYVAGKRQ